MRCGTDPTGPPPASAPSAAIATVSPGANGSRLRRCDRARHPAGRRGRCPPWWCPSAFRRKWPRQNIKISSGPKAVTPSLCSGVGVEQSERHRCTAAITVCPACSQLGSDLADRPPPPAQRIACRLARPITRAQGTATRDCWSVKGADLARHHGAAEIGAWAARAPASRQLGSSVSGPLRRPHSAIILIPVHEQHTHLPQANRAL